MPSGALIRPQVPRLPVKDAQGNLIIATEHRKLEEKEDADDANDGKDEDTITTMDTISDEEDDEEEQDEGEDEYDDDEDDYERHEGDGVREEDGAELSGVGKQQNLVSELEQYHSRQEMIEKHKMQIAQLCTKILEDPEENVKPSRMVSRLHFSEMLIIVCHSVVFSRECLLCVSKTTPLCRNWQFYRCWKFSRISSPGAGFLALRSLCHSSIDSPFFWQLSDSFGYRRGIEDQGIKGSQADSRVRKQAPQRLPKVSAEVREDYEMYVLIRSFIARRKQILRHYS